MNVDVGWYMGLAAFLFTMGAAGVLEAIVAIRGMEQRLWPPTAGLANLDGEIPLDVVCGEQRAIDCPAVISTSSGFAGVNAAVILCREA